MGGRGSGEGDAEFCRLGKSFLQAEQQVLSKLAVLPSFFSSGKISSEIKLLDIINLPAQVGLMILDCGTAKFQALTAVLVEASVSA